MLYAWFALFLLHNLSKIVPSYPAIVALVTGLALLEHCRARYELDLVAIVLATLGVTGYVLMVDVVREGDWPTIGNAVRLVTPFAAMALILSVDLNRIVLERLSIVFLVVVWFAALSIFYQVANGAVWWFAESSERAGVERFASLLGSLTTFGIAVPFALLCVAMYVRGPAGMLFFAVPLLAAGVLSLQKAALMGFLVSLPFVVVLMDWKTASIWALGIVVLVLGVASYVPSSVIEYSMVGWEYFADTSGGGSDVSIAESITSRLMEYPSAAVDYHGLAAMIFGVGLRGGSGVFGFTNDPMAHNGMVDYLLIGGLAYLSYGVCLMILTVVSAARVFRWQSIGQESRRESYFVTGLAVLYMANLPFASGIGFHPALCWIPPVIIAFSAALRRRRVSEIAASARSLQATA